MADDPTDQIVAEHGALDERPDAPPQPAAPDELAQSEEARKARETIGRQREEARERKAPTEEPAAPAPTRETGVEENPYMRFVKGPQDNGPDNLERAKLNMVNSYYRGSAAGALGLSAMASIYNEEDPPDMDPAMKKARQGVRDQYDEIVTSLMRYDMMPSWSGLPQLGAAVGGSIAGGSISPEAFLGWASKGATWTARTAWAALQQGLISGATDPIVQYLNIDAGVQKEFDPLQTGGAVLFGAAVGGGFHAAGEGAGHVLGQRELRRQFLDLADVDPSVGSAERALWRFDPANGYQERVPEFPYERYVDEGGRARTEPGPDHGFADTVEAAKEKLGPQASPEETQQAAFREEAGQGFEKLLDENGIPHEKLDEIAKLYDRQEGETHEAAMGRALDEWVTQQERGAEGSFDDELRKDLEEAKPPAAKEQPPEGWEPAPDQMEEARRLSRGWTPRQLAAPPQSLISFVRKNGGLLMGTPEAGDLLAQDVGRQPGLLRSKEAGGVSADIMAQKAADAGYDLGPLGEIGSGIDVDRFLRMLVEDATGRTRHYVQGVDTEGYFEGRSYNDDTLNHLRETLGVNP